MKPGSALAGSGQTNPGLASSGLQQQVQTAPSGKVLTGDLDSSLASLAENLTINKSATAQKYLFFLFLFTVN